MQRRNAWVLWWGGRRDGVILDIVLWRETLLEISLQDSPWCSSGTAREALPSRDSSRCEKGSAFAREEAGMVSPAPACVHSERVALRSMLLVILLEPRSWSISSWSNFCWKIRSYTVIYSISFLIKDGISGFSEVSDHRVSLWGQEFKLRRWRGEETSPLWSCPGHRQTWGWQPGLVAALCARPPVALGHFTFTHPWALNSNATSWRPLPWSARLDEVLL